MKTKFDRKILAQAATELAIFGAILLFVIGSLVQVEFQQNMGMNEQLRIMRLALTESWKTAQGAYTLDAPGMSRNNSSIMVV